MAKGKNTVAFDTTEIVAVVEFRLTDSFGRKMKKQVQVMNIIYDNILKISFVKCTEKKLFKEIPSEKILIKLKSMSVPVEIPKMNNSEFFEEYKEGFRIFAQRNRIELIDETV